MSKEKFIKAYERSLKTYCRYFYDDFDEYGNRDSPHIFYFIEGIGGVPGQIRFALPSLIKHFGTNIYIKSLNLKEFSSKEFIWNKYTLENINKKRDKIVSDLNNLEKKYKRITIVVSSNGFYDFLYAYGKLNKNLIKKSELIWCAVAPDHFEKTKWENFFYKMNGFTKDGHKWFAFPNNNLLKKLNAELKMTHKWSYKGMKKKFYKNDLEFRFKHFGLWWGYASITCFNELLKHITNKSKYPIDIKSYILVARADGYWQGKSVSEIKKHLDKYLTNKKVVYKKASHLWLLMPENIDEILSLMDK
jgi:hypothetical protein